MNAEERKLWCDVFAAWVRSRQPGVTGLLITEGAKIAADAAVVHFRNAQVR